MNDAGDLLPAGTRLGRSALTVGDEAAVTAFYRDAVGLSVYSREGATTLLGAGETPLLEIRTDPDARPRPTDAAGLFHNAFLLPDRAALGAALNRIRDDDRWTLTGASDHGVSEALYLADPEGNGVEIYCDRPRSEWPRDDDGGIRIGSWPLDLESVAAAADARETAPDGTTLGHVHLEVSSLERAREFYVETLGFGVKTAVPNALFVAAGDYHHHLGCNTWNGRSSPAATDARGLSRYELVVPSLEALETVRRRLEDAGVTVDENGDGGLEFTDPDGIPIRLRAE